MTANSSRLEEIIKPSFFEEVSAKMSNIFSSDRMSTRVASLAAANNANSAASKSFIRESKS